MKIMLRIFFELIKLRLSLLVTFSAAFGHILASSNTLNYEKLCFLVLGGFLITSSSKLVVELISTKSLERPILYINNRKTLTDLNNA